MKLRSVFAVCAGLGLAFTAGRYLTDPPASLDASRVDASLDDTADALALLKPTRPGGKVRSAKNDAVQDVPVADSHPANAQSTTDAVADTSTTAQSPTDGGAAASAPSSAEPVAQKPVEEVLPIGPRLADNAPALPETIAADANKSEPAVVLPPAPKSGDNDLAAVPPAGPSVEPVSPPVATNAAADAGPVFRLSDPQDAAKSLNSDPVPNSDPVANSVPTSAQPKVSDIPPAPEPIEVALNTPKPAVVVPPYEQINRNLKTNIESDGASRTYILPNAVAAMATVRAAQTVTPPATAGTTSVANRSEPPVSAAADNGAGSIASADAPLTPEMLALRTKIRKALEMYRGKMLNTRDHGAWETMHSIIGYGVEKQLEVGGPGGQRVNAIGWLSFNGPSAGERLFVLGSEGPAGRQGPGLQGHPGQFMAILAQCRVPLDYPMQVGGRKLTVTDLVRQEQLTCRSNTELTFKLIGLMHYLKSDATWQDEKGETWSIPRLIKEELAQPVVGAACGGTHRLFALTYSFKKRVQRGEPVTGQYARARTYIRDFQDYTFSMQNPDGTFSTAFFAGRGASPDPQLRLETTGHIAEWLVFSLDNAQLRDPRMVKAINYVKKGVKGVKRRRPTLLTLQTIHTLQTLHTRRRRLAATGQTLYHAGADLLRLGRGGGRAFFSPSLDRSSFATEYQRRCRWTGFDR
ncbi:MAG: hypothetical protein K8T25_10760 [Planctomycetia bacterium]|nr:hypothetical protein [Planctomycetia bacterium]